MGAVGGGVVCVVIANTDSDETEDGRIIYRRRRVSVSAVFQGENAVQQPHRSQSFPTDTTNVPDRRQILQRESNPRRSQGIFI